MEENKAILLELSIENDKYIFPKTISEALAESLGVSRSTIKRALKHLTEQGQIKRIGGKRYGYWEVASMHTTAKEN